MPGSPRTGGTPRHRGPRLCSNPESKSSVPSHVAGGGHSYLTCVLMGVTSTEDPTARLDRTRQGWRDRQALLPHFQTRPSGAQGDGKGSGDKLWACSDRRAHVILVPAQECSQPSMDPNMKGPQLTVRNQDRFINWNEYTTGVDVDTGEAVHTWGQRAMRNPLLSQFCYARQIALKVKSYL